MPVAAQVEVQLAAPVAALVTVGTGHCLWRYGARGAEAPPVVAAVETALPPRSTRNHRTPTVVVATTVTMPRAADRWHGAATVPLDGRPLASLSLPHPRPWTLPSRRRPWVH